MGHLHQETASPTGLLNKNYLNSSESLHLAALSDRRFAPTKRAAALWKEKLGKTSKPHHICPELILHTGPIIKSWLCAFLSSCMPQIKIPKVWRRSLVVAVLKPNKPLEDAVK